MWVNHKNSSLLQLLYFNGDDKLKTVRVSIRRTKLEGRKEMSLSRRSLKQ